MGILFLFLIPWDNMKIAHEDLMSEVRRSKARIMCKNLICMFADSLVEVKKKTKNRRGERKGKKREGKRNSTAISIEAKLEMFPNKRGRVFNETLLLVRDNVAFMVRLVFTVISNSCSMSVQKTLLQ